MSQLTEALGIETSEYRRDFICNITDEFVNSLEHQGFTFKELLDGLANYAWVNTNSIDAFYFLVQASLAVKKAHKSLEVKS